MEPLYWPTAGSPGGDARPSASIRCPANLSRRSVAGPALVAAAVARPQRDGRAVGRPLTGHVQTQARLDAGDGAVGVDPPLLVGPTGAGPDPDPGAVGG